MNWDFVSGVLVIVGEGFEVFGYYWEMVYFCMGDVVGEGFFCLWLQLC